jgi:anaerobic ribonucleoside-triphosphate reductase activating protein
MNYISINKCDVANGNGIRCTVFVAGCSHHCVGCHNPESWDPTAGCKYTKETEEEILDVVRRPHIRGLTLSGGDPLYPQNRDELVNLVKRIKTELPNKDIWIWTGYEFGEIKDTELIKYCDVAVVGRFILGQRDISGNNVFRGSRNQRVLDVQASLKSGRPIGLIGIPNNEI